MSFGGDAKTHEGVWKAEKAKRAVKRKAIRKAAGPCPLLCCFHCGRSRQEHDDLHAKACATYEPPEAYSGKPSPMGRRPEEPGYHIAPIPRGQFGKFSKIEEEFHELKDSISQGNKVMTLIELSDLLGAIEGYLKEHYGDKVSMDDLRKMTETTRRAFLSGARK